MVIKHFGFVYRQDASLWTMKDRFESFTRSQIFIRAFHRWLYGHALGARVREFESRRPYQFRFQISDLRSHFSICRRGLKGKGAGLRNPFMRVRISPSVFRFWIAESGFWIYFSIRIRGSKIQIPVWVGDVIDSIEVLQTSCKGLNPFRSTRLIAECGIHYAFRNRKKILLRT